MADVKEILEHIFSDEKLMGSKLFKDKVYTDQPIIRRASQMQNAPVPAEISDMKAMAYTPEAYWKTSSWLFYNQGKFMENYTDNYELCENFVMYYPTYRDMNTIQLRSYFSWRTEVRKGEYTEARLPFILLYSYELINNIGISSPEEGYHKLYELRRHYAPKLPVITKYLSQWLTDYAVYYQLEPSLIEDSPDMVFDHLLLKLIDYETSSGDEMWDAINKLSSFPIEKSRFYNDNKEEFRRVVLNVFVKLSDYFRNHRQNSLVAKYFGRLSNGEYHPFYAAVFYSGQKIKSADYRLNDIRRYWCINGIWYCEKYPSAHGRNKKLGDLIRSVDSIMRERYGYKYKIKPGDTTQLVVKLINQEIDLLIKEKQRKEAAEVHIDLSLLGNIRSAANSTRDKLIVDDEEYPDEVLNIESTADDISDEASAEENAVSLLTNDEQQFLSALLMNGNWKEAAAKSGTMPSILADSINDKLFDEFGDTVIDFSSDIPEIIEDYADELKNYIREVNNENT